MDTALDWVKRTLVSLGIHYYPEDAVMDRLT
jgi:hypothetical protein